MLLVQLGYSLAFLGVLPSPGWRAQYYLVVTGQLNDFTPNEAVTVLQVGV